MKVKFLTSPTSAPFFLAYNAGETALVDDTIGKRLVELGFAEQVEEEAVVERATSKKASSARRATGKGQKK